MKTINILSIIQGYRSLDTPLFQKLMTCYGIDPIKGIRDYEIDGIESLFAELFKCNSDVSYAVNTVTYDFTTGESVITNYQG